MNSVIIFNGCNSTENKEGTYIEYPLEKKQILFKRDDSLKICGEFTLYKFLSKNMLNLDEAIKHCVLEIKIDDKKELKSGIIKQFLTPYQKGIEFKLLCYREVDTPLFCSDIYIVNSEKPLILYAKEGNFSLYFDSKNNLELIIQNFDFSTNDERVKVKIKKDLIRTKLYYNNPG